MIKRLTSAIFFVFAILSAVSAYALSTVDFVGLFEDGTLRHPDYVREEVLSAPGDQVLYTWHQDHTYFERTLGWNQNDYCDAFVKLNPQFAGLFTDEPGCNNPGFAKLPVNAVWYLPSSPRSYSGIALGSDEAIEMVKTSAFEGPMIFSSKADARPAVTERLRNLFADSASFVSFLRDVLQSELPAGQEVFIGSEAQLRARFGQVGAAPVTGRVQPEVVVVHADEELVAALTSANEWARGWVRNLSIMSAILALLSIFLFTRNRSARKEVKQERTEHAIALNAQKQAEQRATDLQRFKDRMVDEMVIPFELPENMRLARDKKERFIYLPVFERVSAGNGKEMVRVHLGSQESVVLGYDTKSGNYRGLEKVLQRLKGNSDVSEKARAYFGILPPNVAELPVSGMNGGTA